MTTDKAQSSLNRRMIFKNPEEQKAYEEMFVKTKQLELTPRQIKIKENEIKLAEALFGKRRAIAAE